MNDYRVVDMSNSKYIIKGITLGNKANSYFYMDKGTLINKIIIMNKLIIIKYNIFLLITTTSFLLKFSGNHQNN